VSNDQSGFTDALKRCDDLRVRAGATTCVFGIEAGAHYWRNLAYFLDEQKQRLHLINPFTLKRQRDGNDLMRRKNDYRDGEMAAQLLREGKYTWTTLPQGNYAELKAAHGLYQQALLHAAQVKLQLITALDGLFPEFMTVFKGVDGQTALAILTTCPNPATIAGMSLDEFRERIRCALGGRRLAEKKVRAVHQLASQTVGVRADAETQTLAVQLLADRLAYAQTQRQLAEEHLLDVFFQHDESRYLLSIHGLGAVNAAGILAHIGDVRAYSSVKQLPKLAGIVPIENSSADHAAKRTPMSKKGRPNFRLILYRAVIGLLRHNDTIKQYVTRLTQRPVAEHPLKKKEAVGAAMNKLLHIVYALLTKQQMFDPAYAAGA
jgi:transposase